ncbi:hypothetical protein WJ973_23550 [Achromobacter xylosoxidans]
MEDNDKQGSIAVSTPSTVDPQPPLNAEPPDARESTRRTAVEFMGQQGIRTDAWGMEVLKSLLIIAVGALAGAAAMLVNKDKLALATSALATLGLGIGLAFAAFVTGWLVHRTQLRKMYANHDQFLKGASAEVYKQNSAWMGCFFRATVLLAIGSFVCVALGGAWVLVLLRASS